MCNLSMADGSARFWVFLLVIFSNSMVMRGGGVVSFALLCLLTLRALFFFFDSACGRTRGWLLRSPHQLKPRWRSLRRGWHSVSSWRVS
jgi:hypothetical protein